MSQTAGKGYLKETRNLSDKACLLEMMKNVAGFLGDMGFNEFVSVKEIQKIDKQSFVKYFNVTDFILIELQRNALVNIVFLAQFINLYLDPNYQLGPRFSEDDLIKTVKDFGYPGTLAKSALVSSKFSLCHPHVQLSKS